MNTKTITATINAPVAMVYAYAVNPAHLPDWAPGLALAVRREGSNWLVTTARGDVKVSFLPENSWGILDHQVELPDGTVFNNPMRVVPNGEGSEVMFTLFQSPSMTDDQFAADAALITADLNRLKLIVENEARSRPE